MLNWSLCSFQMQGERGRSPNFGPAPGEQAAVNRSVKTWPSLCLWCDGRALQRSAEFGEQMRGGRVQAAACVLWRRSTCVRLQSARRRLQVDSWPAAVCMLPLFTPWVWEWEGWGEWKGGSAIVVNEGKRDVMKAMSTMQLLEESGRSSSMKLRRLRHLWGARTADEQGERVSEAAAAPRGMLPLRRLRRGAAGVRAALCARGRRAAVPPQRAAAGPAPAHGTQLWKVRNLRVCSWATTSPARANGERMRTNPRASRGQRRLPPRRRTKPRPRPRGSPRPGESTGTVRAAARGFPTCTSRTKPGWALMVLRTRPVHRWALCFREAAFFRLCTSARSPPAPPRFHRQILSVIDPSEVISCQFSHRHCAGVQQLYLEPSAVMLTDVYRWARSHGEPRRSESKSPESELNEPKTSTKEANNALNFN